MSATTYPNYSPGLEGVYAGVTQISEVNSDPSYLLYRGIHIAELAKKATFEETAYLLLYGKLPNSEELATFLDILTRSRYLPVEVVAALRLVPKTSHVMDIVRTGFAMTAPFDPDYSFSDHGANIRKAIHIIARAPVLVAAAYRLRTGQEPIPPDPDLGTAANFLYMLSGERPDAYTERVMDSSLILYAEHGFNASTFACRVTVSTLSDIYSGIISGIGTLKGPLHGGANEEAMKMLLEIGTPARAEEWIRDALATKKKIMGFGHREYKHGDPRAAVLTGMAKELGERIGNTTWGHIAAHLERVMVEEKGIYPNVDFPTAYLYYLLHIPIDLYTPIFVLARVAGWSAHAVEQLANNRLIRPRAIYEGPRDVKFMPLADRDPHKE
jgi:2-methylcitrate synthase/citrate synthase II